MNNKYYYASQSIIRKEVFGGIVFLIDNGKYIQVNATGYNILKEIAESSTNSLEKFYKYLDKDELDTFIVNCIKEGILTQNYTNKKMKIIDNKQSESYLSAPVEGYIYLTEACNQKCTFCYFNCKDSGERVPLQSWRGLIDQFESIGVCTLGFLGGEPLLEWEELIELLEYSNGKMWRSITTNGTAGGGIDKEKAKRLRLFDSLEINLSLESYTSEVHDKIVGLKGAHGLAIESLKNLNSVGVSTIIKVVATQVNYREIPRLVQMAKEMGAVGAYIVDYMPYYGETYEHYIKIAVPNNEYWDMIEKCKLYSNNSFFVLANTKYRFREKGKFSQSKGNLLYYASKCAAGSLNIDVMPNGDVYTCPITNGIKRYCIGNIEKESVLQMWRKEDLNIFRDRDYSKLSNVNCKECNDRFVCVGGCPVVAEIFNGSIYGGDVRCPIINSHHIR